jgi:hypothetical protein
VHVASMLELHDTAQREALAVLVDSASVEARRAVAFSLFCSTHTYQCPVDRVLRCFSQDMLIEVLTTARHSFSALLAAPDTDGRPAPLDMLRFIMTEALYPSMSSTNTQSDSESDFPTVPDASTVTESHRKKRLNAVEVTDRIFLRGGSWPGSATKVFVECLRRNGDADDLVKFAELLAGGVWGESAFVARSNATLQASLTFAILQALRRIRSDLEASGKVDGGFPGTLMGMLARGVSVYIDSPDNMTRLHGMRVAVEFSRLMALRSELSGATQNPNQGTPGAGVIEFEELERYEEDGEGCLVLKSRAVPALDDKPSNITSDKFKRVDGDSDSDSDSSDDEDLEAYFLDEVNGRRTSLGCAPTKSNAELGEDQEEEDLVAVHYLRQALALLQFSDSSSPDGSYLNHKSVLTALPALVLARPADGADLTSPLMRELLRLGNSFNMQHFDQLRSSCMHALVSTYPARSVEVLSWAASSDTLSIGVRLEALGIMVDGAYTLAGLKRTATSEKSKHLSVSDEVVDLNDADNPKTIVKRPLRLAALQKEKNQKYFKNSFGELALDFFQPVIAILAAQLDKIEKQCKLKGAASSEGLDVLLPAQCMLSLGAFVRCAVHTTAQRQLLQSLLTIAYPLKNNSSLHLRRASTAALLDCTVALFESLSVPSGARDAIAQQGSQQYGTLGFLMHMAPTELFSNDVDGALTSKSNQSFSALAPTLKNLVTGSVQWAASSAQDEQDTHCKVLMIELVKVAVSFFE